MFDRKYIIIIDKKQRNLIVKRWAQQGNDLKEKGSNSAKKKI